MPETRLDALARERDRLPEWDGDSRDDIAIAEGFFGQVLAATLPRALQAVSAGLESDARHRAPIAPWRWKNAAGRPPGRSSVPLDRERDNLARSTLEDVLGRLAAG